MPTSLRLDDKTRHLLDRLARSGGKTKSDVIREAIHEYGKAKSPKDAGLSLYDSVRHLVGIVEGGTRRTVVVGLKRISAPAKTTLTPSST